MVRRMGRRRVLRRGREGEERGRKMEEVLTKGGRGKRREEGRKRGEEIKEGS